MKKIDAIIQPYKLEDVKEALRRQGRQRGHPKFIGVRNTWSTFCRR